MKRFTFIVLAILLVGYLSYLSVQHYRNYQRQETAVIQASIDDQEARQLASQQREAELVNLYNLSVVQCQKGAAAYELLSEKEQEKVEAPNCGLELVQ